MFTGSDSDSDSDSNADSNANAIYAFFGDVDLHLDTIYKKKKRPEKIFWTLCE